MCRAGRDGTQAAPSSGSGYTALLLLGAYRKRILQKLGHHDWRAGTRGLHDGWRRAADDERRGLERESKHVLPCPRSGAIRKVPRMGTRKIKYKAARSFMWEGSGAVAPRCTTPTGGRARLAAFLPL